MVGVLWEEEPPDPGLQGRMWKVAFGSHNRYSIAVESFERVLFSEAGVRAAGACEGTWRGSFMMWSFIDENVFRTEIQF